MFCKVSRYYSFGMAMPGRTYSNSSYKFGFNGQENDDEIYIGLKTAEFWEYDTRSGRRWNLDPKPIEGISDYSTFRNNPVIFIDPKGDVVPIEGTKKEKRQFIRMLNKTTGNKYDINSEGNLFNKNGKVNTKTNKRKSGELSQLVESAIAKKEKIEINLTTNDNTVAFDRYLDGKVDVHDLKVTPRIFKAGQLAHLFSERLNWKDGYENKDKRTDANWQDAHDNFGIPTESRVVTSMLKIPYGARVIKMEAGEDPYTVLFLDAYHGVMTMTLYHKRSEVWSYGTKNYLMTMGATNNIIGSGMSPTGQTTNESRPKVGQVFKVEPIKIIKK